VTAPCAVQIGLGILPPDLEPDVLYRTVPDAGGTYTIPYIQSADALQAIAAFDDPRVARVDLSLLLGDERVASGTATRKRPDVSFAGLKPGEYTLLARGLSSDGGEVSRSETARIGVGTIIAALGDSITEGYYGHGFRRGLELTADDFPPEAVSRDGRNFPQLAPTTAVHLPEVNCFQSWMTDLNDLLTDSWQHPVFIANEGWGGHSTEAYLNLMHADENWQARMRLLNPDLWLIHLGVNDGRAQVAPAAFAANLRTLVHVLAAEYGAQPNRLLIARPSYDYFEGAEPVLRSYCAQIDALTKELGLAPGPDFFAAYATEHYRWYGTDPVHPNVQGMQRMAELWHEALVAAFPHG